MIKAKCPGCGKTITAGDDWAGKYANCPHCGATIPIPLATVNLGTQLLPPITTLPAQQAIPATIVSPIPAQSQTAVIEHHHKAKGGAFRSGFGLAFGCLVAIFVFFFGGCLFLAMLAGHAAHEVSQRVPVQAPRSDDSVVRIGTPDRDGSSVPKVRSNPRMSDDPGIIPPNASIPDQGVVPAPTSTTRNFDNIKVVNARFYRRESSITPTVELTIRNGADSTISKLFFHCVLQTPGRALPWVEEDMNYEPEGGVEPGETQTWKLRPGILSKLSRADDHSDAAFTVAITDATLIPSTKRRNETKTSAPRGSTAADNGGLDPKSLSKPVEPTKEQQEAALFRQWSSGNGQFTLEAKLASLSNGIATLVTHDGTAKKVPIEKLSQADQDFIAKWKRERR